MVLENDCMIHNVTFSLSVTIKRISTTNSFPYGPLVWRNPTDKRLTVLEKVTSTQVCFFFPGVGAGWGGVGVFGILVSPPGIEPGPPIVGVQSPNHWTTREFPTQDSYPYTTWTAEGAIWVPFYLFWFKGYFSFKLLENSIFLRFMFCHGFQFFLMCFTWKIINITIMATGITHMQSWQ